MSDVLAIRFWVCHEDREALEAWGPSKEAVEARYREVLGVPDDVEVFIGSSVPLPII